MQTSIIHFSHANGFPAGSYRKLFRFLQPEFQIGYIDMHGHHPNYPVTDNWDALVNELIRYIETTYTQPVIGIGHSLGGVLSFIAAAQRPELFQQIILLDAPVLTTVRSLLIHLAKHLGFIDRVTGGRPSKNRRTEWSSREEAITYFKSKPLFRNFDADCLVDYVDAGTESTAKGIRLKFNSQVEYRIYCTLPHNLYRYKNAFKVPGTLIYGDKTYAVTGADRRYMRNNFNMQMVKTRGSHLFPFETPQVTADIIRQIIHTAQSRKV